MRCSAQVLDALRRLVPAGGCGPLRGLLERPDRLWKAGAAVCAAVILLLAGLALGQAARIRMLTMLVDALSARLAAHERVVTLLESPTARTITLSGSVRANARFVYDRATGQGAFVVMDLKDPGDGLVYQLWLLGGEGSRSAGVFRPIRGQAVVIPVTADFRLYDTAAISVEQGPRGSATAPTSAPVLAGTM